MLLAQNETYEPPSKRKTLLFDGQIPVRVIGTYRAVHTHEGTFYEPCRIPLRATIMKPLETRRTPRTMTRLIPASPRTSLSRSPGPSSRHMNFRPLHIPPRQPSLDTQTSASYETDDVSLKDEPMERPVSIPKIPKPQGEVGRPGRGGYNLRMALNWSPSEFNAVRVSPS